VTARNGVEAVEKFKASAKPFTHVFMDVSMPLMNGFEATSQIRQYEKHHLAQLTTGELTKPPHFTQVFAMTGLGSTEAEAEAVTSGMDLFLRKPVKMETVRRLLEGSGP
jgi:CheY-like chemotaxis protein